MELGSQIQHYKIDSILGTGGMGTVYLAEDTRLGRMVALKFLAAEFAADTLHLERFIREARAASSLNHPNICTIYDVSTETQTPFIAMEYVEGDSVSSLIAHGPRPLFETIDIAIQVCEAIHEAHLKGLIHRDIKPSNLVVGPRGRVKVLDFGLAKRVAQPISEPDGHAITRPGMILGTASYMSPEQARGLDLDPRSDVWSLGVTIYEMITGKLPYSGDTVADTLAAVLTGEAARPTQLIPGLDPQVEEILDKALTRRPGDRYVSFAEMLNDLRSLKTKLEREKAVVRNKVSSENDKTQFFSNATTELAPRQITGHDLLERGLRPNNLSRVLSPIIGRESEIKKLIELLRDPGIRLISLTGIGGTGKTKLARSVAEEVLADFHDGVYFIELASVSDPDLIVPSIGKPLGVDDGGSRPVFDALIEKLSDMDILLVVDNFEQVIDGAPHILSILEATSRSKFLVTSRSPLKLSFEKEFPVPPLSIPDPSTSSTEEIRNCEAVRLFETRARSAKPSFVVDEGNAADVMKICSQLDGLPLAIELAAARLRILSAAAIVERLFDRMQLLSGGGRDLPDRHRTMRDMIMWSYELLDDRDRRFFRQLSIFSGTFSIEAAEAICGSLADANLNVLDAVASLCEQSLIVERTTGSGEIRFRMLGVVRDVADELLRAANEYDELAAAHADHFADSVERAEPLIQTASPAEIFQIFELEHDNIRAALTWSMENAPGNAVRIAVALRNFWLLHGHLTEGLSWLKGISSIAAEHATPEQRFKLSSGLGLTARFRGEYETSRIAYESGLAASTEAGDKKSIAASNRGLGLVAMQKGDLETAREHFEIGLKISRELDDDFGVAMSLSFLGDLWRVGSDHEKALPLFEEASKLFRELDRKVALGDSLNNLGTARFQTGDVAGANNAFLEAAEIALEIGNKITLSHSIDGFAAIAAGSNDHPLAARFSGAAEAIREKVGYKNEPAELAFREAYLSKLRTSFDPDELGRLAAEGSIQSTLEIFKLAGEIRTTE